VRLRVDELSVRYGDILALRKVTTAARAGRVTAVVGPNAAGKSTLLRACIGAVKPHEGSVLLDGEPVHRLRTRDLARSMAYVAQRPQVAAAFTVRQVIELGRYAVPPAPSRIDEVIDRLELREIEHRLFPHLSVGQQQRVTLGRALAQLSGDGCLILDEPTSAMDMRHVDQAIDVLRELAGNGATVLLAMHDLSMASRIVDDAWLLDEGGLVASGPAEDVLSPERLEPVFGVGFSWVVAGAGERVLLPLAGRGGNRIE